MIGRALDSGATAAWVAADEVYDHDSNCAFSGRATDAYVLAGLLTSDCGKRILCSIE